MGQSINSFKRAIVLWVVIALAVVMGGPSARAQDPAGDSVGAAGVEGALAVVNTSIPYQGQLNISGAPANALYDFRFRLFDSTSATTPTANANVVDKPGVNVANGLFSVELDFGATAFNNGQARWLEIGVRPGNSASTVAYTTLNPRRPLLAVPYALYSLASAGGSGGNPAYGAATGAPANAVYVKPGPFVGIGTTEPDARLVVAGNMSIANSALDGAPGTQPTLSVVQDAVGVVGRFVSKGVRAGLFLQASGGVNEGVGFFNQPGGRLSFIVAGGTPALDITRNGRVGIGIGTAEPNATLDILGNIAIVNNIATNTNPTLNVSQSTGGLVGRLVSSGTSAGLLLKDGTANNDGVQLRNQGGNFNVVVSGGTPVLNVSSSGYVGIGTDIPVRPLHIKGTTSALRLEGVDHTYVEFFPDGPQTRKAWLGFGSPTSNDLHIANEIEGANIVLDSKGGKVVVDVLEITGGSDLAEPFEIAGTVTIEPGMVVAIDPDNPGQLRLADAAYDRTVAGVISGAGGINPGLILQQEGSVAAGEYPVALTGRVYVYADAANGPIEPGDLLTTSATPGHAMKVTDHVQAQGAILGKAMSRLEEGTGLVLVLVTLQ